MTTNHDESSELFDQAAEDVVEIGNKLTEGSEDADPWEVSSGMLLGAVQFWMFTHQPCDEDGCEGCADIATAHQRLTLLLDEVRDMAESSEYFHSPNDLDVGKA